MEESHGLTVDEVPRITYANPMRIRLRDVRTTNPQIQEAVRRILDEQADVPIAAFQSSI